MHLLSLYFAQCSLQSGDSLFKTCQSFQLGGVFPSLVSSLVHRGSILVGMRRLLPRVDLVFPTMRIRLYSTPPAIATMVTMGVSQVHQSRRSILTSLMMTLRKANAVIDWSIWANGEHTIRRRPSASVLAVPVNIAVALTTIIPTMANPLSSSHVSRFLALAAPNRNLDVSLLAISTTMTLMTAPMDPAVMLAVIGMVIADMVMTKNVVIKCEPIVGTMAVVVLPPTGVPTVTPDGITPNGKASVICEDMILLYATWPYSSCPRLRLAHAQLRPTSDVGRPGRSLGPVMDCSSSRRAWKGSVSSCPRKGALQ